MDGLLATSLGCCRLGSGPKSSQACNLREFSTLKLEVPPPYTSIAAIAQASRLAQAPTGMCSQSLAPLLKSSVSVRFQEVPARHVDRVRGTRKPASRKVYAARTRALTGEVASRSVV